MTYLQESKKLLKEIFPRRFKEYKPEKIKKGDIYIEYGFLNLVINDCGATEILKSVRSMQELYSYCCGLYDMKFKKIQDTIKLWS